VDTRIAIAATLLGGLLGASSGTLLPRLAVTGPLARDRECAQTTIVKIANRDRYRDALDGTHFALGRDALSLEFGNGWKIDNYTPLGVAFEDDPHTVLAFRLNDQVQVCPIQRTYCDDDRGDWQVGLRVYDFAAKESIKGFQSRCRQLLPDSD